MCVCVCVIHTGYVGCILAHAISFCLYLLDKNLETILDSFQGGYIVSLGCGW